jgi:tellurite methyltransferase
LKKDKIKWDEKYRSKASAHGNKPNSFLKKHIRLLHRGKALDIAAGEGQNAVFLAQQGFEVEAVDISPIGLAKARKLASAWGLKIKTVQADLDDYKIEAGRYDLITNFYFLDRRLFPRIKRGLKKGGKIVFETYTTDHPTASGEGLMNPKYLLKPNELLERFRDLRILFYREGIFREGGRRKAIASLIAEKTGPKHAEKLAQGSGRKV